MVTLDRAWLLTRLTLFLTPKVCLLAGSNTDLVSCSTNSDCKPQTGQNSRKTKIKPQKMKPEDGVRAMLKQSLNLELSDRELNYYD